MNLLQQITHYAFEESEALGLPRTATHAQRMAAIEVLKNPYKVAIDALKNPYKVGGLTEAGAKIYYQEALKRARADYELWSSSRRNG